LIGATVPSSRINAFVTQPPICLACAGLERADDSMDELDAAPQRRLSASPRCVLRCPAGPPKLPCQGSAEEMTDT